MKNMKRISKITIKRMSDVDPDTSYLGEYSNTASSEFSIDREHSLDCPINTGETPIAKKTRNVSDIAKSRCECSDSKCPTACNGKCQMAASYLFFRTDMEDLSGTMFCGGCGNDAYESGIYASAADDDMTEPECDCGERGDMTRGELRYFNGNVENYKGESAEDIRKHVRQDYERMERLQRGDWGYLGIRAEAEILIPSGNASIAQEITSGGLWGIESDGNGDYMKEIESEQLSELREQLHAIGFSKRAISAAFKNVRISFPW